LIKVLKTLEIIHNTKNDALLQTRLTEFGIARRELVKAKNRGLATKDYIETARGNILAEWRLSGWAKTLTPWFWLKRHKWAIFALVTTIIAGAMVMIWRMI